jgi:hypothetical protein
MKLHVWAVNNLVAARVVRFQNHTVGARGDPKPPEPS